MLTGANLTGTILTGADLTGVILTRADLIGAILKDVDLSVLAPFKEVIVYLQN